MTVAIQHTNEGYGLVPWENLDTFEVDPGHYPAEEIGRRFRAELDKRVLQVGDQFRVVEVAS